MNDKSPDPPVVLGAYLDDMLQVPTGEAEAAPRVLTRPAILLPEWLLAPPAPGCDARPVAEIEIFPQKAVAATLGAAVTGEATAFTPAGSGEKIAAAAGHALALAGYLFPLQCLMFRLGRHLMAIPLTGLGSVHKLEQAPTRLPESPSGLLGMVDVRGSRLQVVDGLHLLSGGDEARVDFALLLVLGDSRWAIGCDRIEQVVGLDADDVKWGQRKLCLGTIRHSLAGLLDPGAVIEQLESVGRAEAD